MDINDYFIHMPGRICEYDPVLQHATVLISNDRVYSSVDEFDQQVTPGLLYDVPVFTPGGGGWHMTFPIKPGDTCLLSFSQFGYDHWLWADQDAAGSRSDGQPQQWVNRTFDLADGFAQVGWNNVVRAIDNYSADASQWRNGDATQKISLDADTSIMVDSPVKVVVTSPVVKLDSPEVEVTGKLTVGAGLDVTGTATATVDFVSAGVSGVGHTHGGGSPPD